MNTNKHIAEPVLNAYSLFEQITNISKAHGYDIVAHQAKELKEQNEIFRKALREVLEKIMNMDTKQVIESPALLIQEISTICTETLWQNRPL